MKRKSDEDARPALKRPKQVSTEDVLRAQVHRNRAMEVKDRRNGTCLVEVPLRRPRWMVPPISWVLPFSSRRRVELDALGTSVLKLCEGRRTVEEIIEKFAADHKLSFREAQLSVTRFLEMLSQRGIVAIVGVS
jgi:hypothetical protein